MNRQYASALGRFGQADPYEASGFATDPRSWNRYSYTRNVLTTRVDPLGLADQGAGPNAAGAYPFECTNCGGNEIYAGADPITSTGGTVSSLGEAGTGRPPRPPLVDAQGGGPGGIDEPATSPAKLAKRKCLELSEQARQALIQKLREGRFSDIAFAVEYNTAYGALAGFFAGAATGTVLGLPLTPVGGPIIGALGIGITGAGLGASLAALGTTLYEVTIGEYRFKKALRELESFLQQQDKARCKALARAIGG